jgi:hypothetical protein
MKVAAALKRTVAVQYEIDRVYAQFLRGDKHLVSNRERTR